ncbi:MAG TPA: RHS repeat-associated core domain-containing protein [Bdellovibrio sp.]|uniref:RHS repeat-associated core domain-containing protein n=1 Tax=Bdellovibrio sp. TaxID=28201 RepID=UPI002F076F90
MNKMMVIAAIVSVLATCAYAKVESKSQKLVTQASVNQFAQVTFDHANKIYQIGQKANVTANILKTPDVNFRVVLESWIYQNGKSTWVTFNPSGNQYFYTSPALNSAGEVDLQVNFYFENIKQSDALRATISSSQKQIQDIEKELAQTPNPDLQKKYDDLVALVKSYQLKLSQSRTLVFGENEKITVQNPSQPPTAKLALTPTSGDAPLTVLVDASGSSDPLGNPLSYKMEYGDGVVETSTSARFSHVYQNAQTYSAKLTVTSSSGLQDTKSIQVNVTTPVLPPSPATQAPQIPQTVVTTVADSTSFLYSGANPVQQGVQTNAINKSIAGVLRGVVYDQNKNPLSGVKVSVKEEPEVGYTLTRDDGTYDLAFNPDETLTVQFSRNGYFPAQVSISPSTLEYTAVDDVTMTAPDSKVNPVSLGTGTAQTAVSTPVTDSFGTRSTKIYIPSGTTGNLLFDDGHTTPMTSLALRITEYGANTQDCTDNMPASLPSNTGLAYGVEINSDEAIALGASHIQFSNNVAVYTDNFLGFPVGSKIPFGTYDYKKAIWVPEKDSRVISVLSISRGQITLDVDGAGQAATADELNALNITTEELQKIAMFFSQGSSFVRTQINHFCGAGSAPHIQPPTSASDESQEDNTPVSADQASDQKNCPKTGSIIDVGGQSLGEQIPVVGTPLSLFYNSSRAPGKTSSKLIVIPIIKGAKSSILQSLDLKISVAGQIYQEHIQATDNLTKTYQWDGNDAYGRPVPGIVKAKVTIFYNYSQQYLLSTDGSPTTFGSYPTNTTASGITARACFQRKRTFSVMVGSATAANEINGWTLSNHHFYDPTSRTIYYGDGTKVTTPSILGSKLPNIVKTVGQFSSPAAILKNKDGSFYIIEQGIAKITLVGTDGTRSTIAGTGTAGFNGDGGPATSAQIAVGIDSRIRKDSQGNLYFSDTGNHRIRKIATDGTISTVVGTGVAGYNGDGIPATQAQLNSPAGFVFDNGKMYIADSGNNRIRVVYVDGTIDTVAGNGTAAFAGNNGPATKASLNNPLSLAISKSSGNIYISDYGNNRIRKVAPTGIISTAVGGGGSGFAGDGGPAVSASIRGPDAISLQADGSYFFADKRNNRIRWVSPTGVIQTIIGNGAAGYAGDGGPAELASFNAISSFNLNSDGSLLITDSGNNVLRSVSPGLPGVSTTNISIPSSDGGEIYVFSSAGVHLKTLNALTNAVRWTFGYNDAGLLISATDGDGNVTSLTRDSNGLVTSITSPYGAVTQLSSDGNGYLASVANPNGETYQLKYATGGLLSEFVRPNGKSSKFDYDSTGLLIKDTNANGGFTALLRTLSPSTGTTIQMSTAENMQSTRQFSQDYFGTGVVADTHEDGTTSLANYFKSSFSNQEPSGDQVSIYSAADTRLGAPASYNSQTSFLSGGSPSSSPAWFSVVHTRTYTYPNPGDTSTFVRTDKDAWELKSQTSTYDSSTKTFTDVSALDVTSTRVIDDQGRPLRVQTANLAATVNTYDSHGRLVSSVTGDPQVDGSSRTTTFSYNAQGLLGTVTDALGRTTSYTYDASQRPLTTTFNDGRSVTYEYDQDGNVTGVTPPSRPKHIFGFDAIDSLISYLAPTESRNTTYSYNLDKKLTGVSRPDGQTLNYVYDGTTGQLTSIQENGNSSYSFTYLPTGQLGAQSSPDGISASMTYLRGLLSTVTQTGAVQSQVSYTYDSDYRVSGITAGGISVPYTYFRDNAQFFTAGDMALLRYSSTGLLSGLTLDATAEGFVRNSFGDILEDKTQVSNASVFDVTYGHDGVGRIATKSEILPDGTQNSYEYGYDSVGRLVQVKKNGTVVSTYSYDDNGNRTSATISGVSVSSTFDNEDKLLTSGTKKYTYNANGDLASVTDGSNTSTFTYDAFGNLKAASVVGKSITYVVDAQNRRVGKLVGGTLVQGFVYQSGLQIAAELDGNSQLVSRFVYASKANVPDYMIKGGVKYRIVSDQVGSVRYVINSTDGTIAQAISYDEFGNVLSDSNPGFQPFGFAGGLYDQDTKLVRFGARDYDPSVGRWTSKDPLLFGGKQMNLFGYVGTVGKVPRMETNLYGYALQDPINFIDPTGLFSEDWVKDHTTPNQQLVIGTTAAVAGGACIKSGFSTLNLPLILTGIGLGYEGGKNIIKAKERGAPEIPNPLDAQ